MLFYGLKSKINLSQVSISLEIGYQIRHYIFIFKRKSHKKSTKRFNSMKRNIVRKNSKLNFDVIFYADSVLHFQHFQRSERPPSPLWCVVLLFASVEEFLHRFVFLVDFSLVMD